MSSRWHGAVGVSAATAMAATATLLLAVQLSAAAHATAAADPVRVSIDVKPGDSATTIQPDREGMLPVAILSMESFDATTVDPATVRFGPTGSEARPFRTAQEDVDGDGDTDMMLLFRMRETGIRCGDTSVSLKGTTQDGTEIEGSEAVTTEGCA